MSRRAALAPVRPGPGPVPSVVVRRLDLRVRRRVHGLLPGDVRSTVLGAGTELAQIRPYHPGDDVRAIDWNVTARTGEPHVRLHVAERALTTWIALDTSASMRFGTGPRTKADVAEGVVLALSHSTTSGANRLGVVATNAGGRAPAVVLPPSGDRRLVLRLLSSLLEDEATPGPQDPDALARCITLTDRVSGRSGAVVVISDLRGSRAWERPLARLAQRHHVLIVEIVDPREQELVDAGELVLSDPETGRQLRVDTSDAGLRRRFAEAARAEREDVRRATRRTGGTHVTVDTSGDWLRSLSAALARRGDVRR
jgi:uncharacterized protein (DUF58 family)